MSIIASEPRHVSLVCRLCSRPEALDSYVQNFTEKDLASGLARGRRRASRVRPASDRPCLEFQNKPELTRSGLQEVPTKQTKPSEVPSETDAQTAVATAIAFASTGNNQKVEVDRIVPASQDLGC